MNQRSIIVAVAASLALAVPVGSATWMSHGDYEPNTVLDDPAFNWADAPAPGVQRIYFNAYSTVSDGATGGGMNPNAGAIRSHIEPAGNEQQYAVFGLWNDCNNDGYVGHAESAWREYPAALLTDDSRCSSHETATASCWTTVTPGNPCPAWPTDWHNVDGWVTELLVITNIQPGGDRRVIVDPTAHVWGDYGKPGVITNDAGTCPISPFPRGSTQSTGGALTFADCYTGILAGWNSAVDAAGDPLGLRFADEDDGTSGTLGQTSTLGDTDSDNAIVRTGNCDEPDAYLLAWPAGLPPAFYENFHNGVRGPDTDYGVNPSGSVAGTVNYTRESGPFPDSESGNAVASTSNCDFDDDRGDDAFPLEGDSFTTSATNKIQSDWNFGWSVQSRGGLPLGTPLNGVGGGTGAAGGAPSDAGLEPFNAFCLICQQTEWSGGSVNVAKTPQALALRTDLEDPGAEIDGAYWLTFYAFASTGVAEKPSGIGTYGSHLCGDNDEGVFEGFNCDATAWNKNPDGTDVEPSTVSGQYHLAKPGDRYNFLDVDCFDGSVTPVEGTTVAVLPAAYGDSPCSVG